ncbi:hypothetical protein [Streptomyces sp. NPDC020983]|uniref:hypothetical protein n=1 Tax=Streptomyces sp. NPDC020983 TaxID=3365106 RepID=UPI0037AE7309
MSTPTPPPAPAAPAPAGDPTPPAPVVPAPVPAPPATPPAQPPAGQPQDVASLPDWAQTLIHNTRQEAAGHRTRATAAEQQQQTVLQGIAQALGITPQGTPDPAQLQASLSAAQETARQNALRAALYETASEHGANPAALRDSVSFLESAKGIDPSDTAAVVAAARAAVAANASLAATPTAPAGPPAGPADLDGGNPGAPRQLTEADLATMTPEQIVKAQDDGLLRNLLGG